MGIAKNSSLEQLIVVGGKRCGVQATAHIVDICCIRGLETSKFSGTQRDEGCICVVIWILLLKLSQGRFKLILDALAGVGRRAEEM